MLSRYLRIGLGSRNLITAILLVVVGSVAAALILATVRSSAATPSGGTPLLSQSRLCRKLDSLRHLKPGRRLENV